MDSLTSNYIDTLLNDSELFSSKPISREKFQDYNFEDEIILITGAAGSIGSGLAKQLISSSYKKLILIDVAESPLYHLQKEIEQLDAINIDFFLLNITDEESMEWLFQNLKPSLIFHTAAYKHVPLMESNPYEAIKLNVFGTKLLADLSIKYHVKRFVFISTDKAVNPINVMGITKQIAERYLSSLNNKKKTIFSITRFGNILGSNGSVVPLFIKQIEAGKPLTITDKDISRYFICKHKACDLILKIAAFKDSNCNIYTFNMGKPIKIIDLAKKITTLNKYKNDTISIKITELRPGEKLHEDIITNNETLESTKHEDILLVTTKDGTDTKSLNLDDLKQITPYLKPTEIKSVLESYS